MVGGIKLKIYKIKMKYKGIQIRGCNWIMVNKELHTFCMGEDHI